jgi:hypothetical protein
VDVRLDGPGQPGVQRISQRSVPFDFLLFLSNLVQLFALPILAVGQQVLSRASDKQAELTFRDAEAILKLRMKSAI